MMKRLRLWLLRRQSAKRDDDGLPFTPDEFARLLTSRNPADRKLLTAGLAAPPSPPIRRARSAATR